MAGGTDNNQLKLAAKTRFVDDEEDNNDDDNDEHNEHDKHNDNNNEDGEHDDEDDKVDEHDDGEHDDDWRSSVSNKRCGRWNENAISRSWGGAISMGGGQRKMKHFCQVLE
jgi:hypothetical protein